MERDVAAGESYRTKGKRKETLQKSIYEVLVWQSVCVCECESLCVLDRIKQAKHLEAGSFSLTLAVFPSNCQANLRQSFEKSREIK